MPNDDRFLSALVAAKGPQQGADLYECGQVFDDPDYRNWWYTKLLEGLRDGRLPNELLNHFMYRSGVPPVAIRDFIEMEDGLGKGHVIYPLVKEELAEINSGKYIECVLTGGIGSAKTTIAHYTIAYQLYILSCLRDPHALFKLDPASEILFVFQSLNLTLSKNLEFNRFKALLEDSAYFSEVFPFDKDIESRLKFPNRIEVVPVSGSESATIGQNVIGGVLDEVNYMAVVEKSKSDVDGGTYDQAWALYNSIARRRKSRFVVGGKTYGMLCLVSSKRFPGQFTDVKEEESRNQLDTRGKTDIYIYDKCVWDVKPEGTYGEDDWFYVFIGDENRQPIVLTDEEYSRMAEEDMEFIRRVPGEYYIEFERDIINALREVAGVSTLARSPFIPATAKVSACMGKVKSIFNRESTILGVDKLQVFKSRILNRRALRFAHVDLSRTGDSTGVAIGHVDKFVSIDRGDVVETLPHIVIDGMLEIKPPRFGEIEYERVRKIFYLLRKLGMPVKWVTFDSYQSVDSMQILKNQGFVTGLQSMDTSLIPYRLTKAALYDGRIEFPTHKLLYKELRSLEYDPEKDKVDHPSNGSKDVADAFAGVVYGLTVRREIWVTHEIPARSVPDSLLMAMQKTST